MDWIDLSDVLSYIEEIDNEEVKDSFFEEIEELKDKAKDIERRVEQQLDYESEIKMAKWRRTI